MLVDSARGPVALDALDPAPESTRGFQILAGDPATIWQSFAGGALIAAEPLAWRLQLKPGDSLVLDTPHGARSFPIAGVYREYGNDRGGVLMRRAVYRRLWGDESVSGLGIYLDHGVNADAVIAAMYAAASARQALLIGSNADVRSLSMSIFERTFVVTRVLDWLAAGVAAVGLVSALLAWQLEHTHELAVLRSVGLTPAGTAILIESQTGFMGLVALLAAIPAGLATAILLVEVINRRAFGWQIDLHVRPSQIGSALALSLAAAFVAGLYPAWRNMRCGIAGALREE